MLEHSSEGRSPTALHKGMWAQPFFSVRANTMAFSVHIGLGCNLANGKLNLLLVCGRMPH